MSNKSIHIVFQVLNFLHSSISSSLNLLPLDKLILINLASHKGPKGICPSTLTIAKELKVSKRHIVDRLSYLQTLTLNGNYLIKINKSPGKRSHYYLSIPMPELSTTGEPQFTSEVDFTGEPQFTTVVNHSSQTGEPQFTQSTKSNKTSNPERGRKNRAHPLPVDYLHTELHEDKAQEMGMEADEFFDCKDKFMAHHKAKGTEKVDWDAEFDLWLIREERFRAEETAKRSLRAADRSSGSGSGRGQQEVRSTVPWFNGRDPLTVGNILDKGLLNGHGRKN